MAKLMHYKAPERSIRENIPFDITIEDVLELIGNGVCPVFGTPYDLSARKITNASASLDKFIPNLGYVKENCAVISYLANRIKTNATVKQIRQVLDWMERR